jgi:hypothetical protein
MNAATFWDMWLRNPYVNRRFGGTHRLRLLGKKCAAQETIVQQVASQNMATFTKSEIKLQIVTVKIQIHDPRVTCKFWGFHGGNYEECRLLRCDAVWVLPETTIRRNVSPPSLGWKELAS